MDKNTIRSIIFLVAGLLTILFPKQLHKFQSTVLKKLRIKSKRNLERIVYIHTGIVLIALAIALFALSVAT